MKRNDDSVDLSRYEKGIKNLIDTFVNSSEVPEVVKPLFGINDDKYYETVCSQFKDPDNDDVNVLIVKDMLLTGFDAPVEGVLYVDKSMKGHNLLQAIARVNRVFEGKGFGDFLTLSLFNGAYAPASGNFDAAPACDWGAGEKGWRWRNVSGRVRCPGREMTTRRGAESGAKGQRKGTVTVPWCVFRYVVAQALCRFAQASPFTYPACLRGE